MSLLKCCFDTNEVPEVIESIAKKCSEVGCCCGCCNALRPRYKRLVDNIFPVNPQDGLVKANMEKLTFFALSSPEKLDRIGEYFFQKASRDIYRKKHGFVIIAMEAMDQLLVACHAQTLNLFVESFLKMVQKLLESTDPQLQILATQSFVKFANIEEDTPSYHRRYDFFVSKFSSMCHSNDPDLETRNNLRLAGIRGLQAVVRKTVSDDLVENIWEPVHMDKIVPSLLYNMENSSFSKKKCLDYECPPEDLNDPPMLAETCLRELVGRASFGHIRSVLKPVLQHLDLHKLWVPNQFAIHTFRIIIFSIQAQYSYTVVESLMAHLDQNSKSDPKIRTNIADVLSKIIAIAASESIGPSVLEIINSLLRHLRVSVTHGTSQHDEKLYQEALINALGEFANHLPDYQKIEIMMFIMSKVPYPLVDNTSEADILLQSILLKSLLKVGTKYQSIHLNTTFPISFLDPLLRMSLAPEPEMRLLVQKIFHTLIDRHHNLEKLSQPTINVSGLDLVVEKSSRPDLIFINKHGPIIYESLYKSLQINNNNKETLEAVYTTLALLCVELASHESIVDIILLILGIQTLALTSPTLNNAQKFNLHAIAISLLALVPVAVNISSLQTYADRLIADRVKEAPHLLPGLKDHYAPNCESANNLPFLMIDQMAITECLNISGVEGHRVQQGSPYNLTGMNLLSGQHRHSWIEVTARGSNADLPIGADSADSASSSPGFTRYEDIADTESFVTAVDFDEMRPHFYVYPLREFRPKVIDELFNWSTHPIYTVSPEKSLVALRKSCGEFEKKSPLEDLSYDAMKKILTDPPELRKELDTERQLYINELFRTAPFSELVQFTRPKHDLQAKLNEIFRNISNSDGKNTSNPSIDNVPIYEKHFPEMFMC